MRVRYWGCTSHWREGCPHCGKAICQYLNEIQQWIWMNVAIASTLLDFSNNEVQKACFSKIQYTIYIIFITKIKYKSRSTYEWTLLNSDITGKVGCTWHFILFLSGGK